MSSRRFEIERFSVTTSMPFDAVVTALKDAVGRLDLVEFAKASKQAGTFAAPPRQVELLVFLQYEGALIAAFRVEAGLTEEVEHYYGARKLEHAYVSNEWFHFENAPVGSALTIFITKKDDALRLFTLKVDWESVGNIGSIRRWTL